MDEEYEIFDVIDEYGAFPTIAVKADSISTVYVDKKRYDDNLLQGQETKIKAFVQAKKDLPRSQCFVNGRLTRSIGSVFPFRFIRYCTQSVLALPLELLMYSTNSVIAECTVRCPMFVHVSENDIHIHKSMRIMNVNNVTLPVDIHVFADNDSVTLTFRFGNADQEQKQIPITNTRELIEIM